MSFDLSLAWLSTLSWNLPCPHLVSGGFGFAENSLLLTGKSCGKLCWCQCQCCNADGVDKALACFSRVQQRSQASLKTYGSTLLSPIVGHVLHRKALKPVLGSQILAAPAQGPSIDGAAQQIVPIAKRGAEPMPDAQPGKPKKKKGKFQIRLSEIETLYITTYRLYRTTFRQVAANSQKRHTAVC